MPHGLQQRCHIHPKVASLPYSRGPGCPQAEHPLILGQPCQKPHAALSRVARPQRCLSQAVLCAHQLRAVPGRQRSPRTVGWMVFHLILDWRKHRSSGRHQVEPHEGHALIRPTSSGWVWLLLQGEQSRPRQPAGKWVSPSSTSWYSLGLMVLSTQASSTTEGLWSLVFGERPGVGAGAKFWAHPKLWAQPVEPLALLPFPH